MLLLLWTHIIWWKMTSRILWKLATGEADLVRSLNWIPRWKPPSQELTIKKSTSLCIHFQAVKTHRPSTGPSLDSEYNEELNEDDSQSDEKDQDTLETDAMIKKKTKSSKPSKSEKDKESRKGKGKSSKKWNTFFHSWQLLFAYPADQSQLALENILFSQRNHLLV